MLCVFRCVNDSLDIQGLMKCLDRAATEYLGLPLGRFILPLSHPTSLTSLTSLTLLPHLPSLSPPAALLCHLSHLDRTFTHQLAEALVHRWVGLEVVFSNIPLLLEGKDLVYM